MTLLACVGNCLIQQRKLPRMHEHTVVGGGWSVEV